MIDDSELRTRARGLGIDPSHIEKDYILNCILASIAERNERLVFRGGTALARLYWPDYRLSEDLDFITNSPSVVFDLQPLLAMAVEAASAQSGRSLELDFGSAKGGWSRSVVRSGLSEILVDVNFGDRAYLPVEEKEIALPYSDLRSTNRRIAAVQVSEILGNKWFMLEDRNEPRDLYDVWAGLEQFAIPFEELVRGHRAKYGFTPQVSPIDTAARMESQWASRLAHQLMDLPPFEQVLSSVRRHYDDWLRSTRSGIDDPND